MTEPGRAQVAGVSTSRDPAASPRWLVPAGVLSCAAVFGLLARWSWGRWPDVLVDFGRELYVPWRLLAGDVLYTDIAYFNGPLSPYLNALFFACFGVGLSTLVWANLAILAVFAAALFWLLFRVGDALAAMVGVIAFLCIFAFGHLVAIGNYNFVTPYSHEMVHGVALSVLALACAARSYRGRPGVWLCAAGAALGLVALTKAEITVAAAVGVLACAALQMRWHNLSAEGAPRTLGWLALGAVVPPLTALALLGVAMPASEALAGILGSWPGIFRGEAGSLRFYQHWMGTDDPLGNLGRMFGELGFLTLWLVPAAFLDRAIPSVGRRRFAAIAAVAAATLAVALAVEPRWMQLGRSLPLCVAGLLALAALRLTRAKSPEERAWASLGAGFAAFALVLLAKMMLFARLFHYGFALAAPAALVLVVGLLVWIPTELRRLGGSGSVFRAVCLGLIAAATIGYLQISDGRYAEKTTVVAAGADTFWARPPAHRSISRRAHAVGRVLDEIERRLPADATLLVVPEGIMLNYLSRRASPTRYINFLPPELILFGEDRIVSALEDAPPDAVILVHKDTTEYGHPLFGRDYARKLAAWIHQRYAASGAPIGDPPLRPDTRFGIAILEPSGDVGGGLPPTTSQPSFH